MWSRSDIKAKLAREKRLAPLLIVLLALGGVVGLAAALPKKQRDVPAAPPPVVNVEILTVQAIPAIEDEFVLHGVVEPDRTVMVAAEVSGQIERIGCRESDLNDYGKAYEKGRIVAEGQPVAKGDCLVILNTDLIQAEYDRAKAQAEYDKREFARMQELFEERVAAKQEVDRAETAMAVSKATLEEAAEKLDRSEIRAPISGILNGLVEEVGQYVQPGTYVAQIVDIDTVKVILDVPERDVYFLKVGDPATVLVDPVRGRQIVGEVTFISELADDRSRTTRVEVSVDNKERHLRSGQIVRARLTRRTLKDVVMIPLASVIPLEDGKVVYLVGGDKAQRRRIELDMDFIKGTKIRVLEGLSGGEKLIVAGHRYVGDGQKVIIRDSRSKDAVAVKLGS